METQYTEWTRPLLTAFAAALIFAVFNVLPRLNYKAQLAKLPVFGAPATGEKQRQMYLTSAKQIYLSGYEKFKDSVYRIVTADGQDTVVVPLSLLPELRKLGDEYLSFPSAVEDIMEVKYTKVQAEAHLLVQSVRSDLTPALHRVNAAVKEEIDRCVPKYIPAAKDWTEVHLYTALVDIVARVSGRVFVGPELCQNAEYLDCAINYTLDLINAVNAIKKLRPWFRPFTAPRCPEVQRLRQREKRAALMLRPIVRQRMEAAKDPNWVKPDDMAQWMMDRGASENMSLEELAKYLITLNFAAIHTTSMATMNTLSMLASTPEYIEPLREEVRTVLAEHDGNLSTKALQQMEKLDSYMKEVQRLYPASLTSFNRRVLKGITLSNGQYLPPGVIIETATLAVHTDDAFYPDGTKFDGFRHYKLRHSSSNDGTDHAGHQFVSMNEQSLDFGYGRHACPGRFFAANEIKMILANVVLEYDVMVPGGVTKRYEQIYAGRQSGPDPTKTLLFRKTVV